MEESINSLGKRDAVRAGTRTVVKDKLQVLLVEYSVY